MLRQLTATCYLLHEGKFLLLFHPKHKKWLPPGGHVEKNETPPEAAVREVLEETGLRFTFILQENVWIDEKNGKSIERPFCCVLEKVPARGTEPEHEHIDCIFLGIPLSCHPTDGRWFTPKEIEALIPHEEVFPDTQSIVRSILSSTHLSLPYFS